MDIKSPKSEPAKSIEKPNVEKAEKKEIALKPDDKPKPKNKIERPKVDINKEPRNKIQREKIDLHTPARNKIERPKIDLHKEPRNKIQREKIDLDSPARNKIERPKIDLNREPTNKIQPYKKIPEVAKSKIGGFSTDTPKNTIKPEGTKLLLEQIKDEMKNFDWKSVSENWSIKTSSNQYSKEININLDPTQNPSKENPLYRNKPWLKSVYNNPSWNLSGTKLGKICGVDQKTISRWLKKFNIPAKRTRANLFNDRGQKECGRCHNIKPHNEFGSRIDSRSETKYLRYNCKSCMIELGQIKNLKNKFNVVNKIYGGKLGGKCQKCNASAEKLPSLEFHHPYPELKSKSLRMRDDWKKNVRILEKEKATILCKNCHSIEGSNIYNRYKSLINGKINGDINAKIRFIRNSISISEDLRRVVQLTKKQEVTMDLYGGTCTGCRKITAHDHLPAIQFHHRDGRNDIKGSETYKKIKNYEYNHMKEWLKKENCVALCGNCHKMVHSTHFEQNHKDIIGIEHSEEVKKIYDKIRKNIKEYQQENKVETKQLTFDQIKEEIKKVDWKSVSENWTVDISANKEVTLNPYTLPSNENPLYKHKKWLQTIYNNKTWNLNDNMLARISGVSNISYWRRKFKIPTNQSHQKLFNDGKQKECGQCNQIKPITQFGSRMSNGKKALFSRCKECKTEVGQVYRYKNKVKIIQNVYNGKLNGKCQMCSTSIEKLPALEFHHLDQKLKTKESISLSRNWEETKKQVEREKATILCENCHTKQRSKHYNNHEKIIQENNLSPLATNNQISKYVINRLPMEDYEVRRQVSRSIKKKIIIDHLYKGKCVGCGDADTKNNLPALQFHHRDKNNSYKMSKTYNSLRNLETKKIIEELKKENCIPLCGNCHRMEHATQFKNNYEKIVAPEYWNYIKKTYKKIENNIKNFKF